jgi:catechol 2,3-dioxygenase-like lactoylglutathione lyase family enzyme
MRIDHIAVASNSEEESSKFFTDLLGLKKVRDFILSAHLMEQFFDIRKDQKIIRYSDNEMDVEVFITNKKSRIKDRFTHSCLLVKNKLELIEKANIMGYKVIKVARKESDDFYLFLKDKSGNIYEIKSK